MLDEEAISLFRAEMKGVKPLKQDTFVAARPHKKKALATIKEQREQQEIFLDLHGLTREQAKLELAALIQTCEKEHLYCASVMTGYGTYTLKRQIPRWLVQHPKVRALHQAPKEWGGEAAILILIDV